MASRRDASLATVIAQVNATLAPFRAVSEQLNSFQAPFRAVSARMAALALPSEFVQVLPRVADVEASSAPEPPTQPTQHAPLVAVPDNLDDVPQFADKIEEMRKDWDAFRRLRTRMMREGMTEEQALARIRAMTHEPLARGNVSVQAAMRAALVELYGRDAVAHVLRISRDALKSSLEAYRCESERRGQRKARPKTSEESTTKARKRRPS